MVYGEVKDFKEVEKAYREVSYVKIYFDFCSIGFMMVLSLVLLVCYLGCDYYMQKKKYTQIIHLVDGLDEKYFISEILPKSSNLENKAYMYALKQACKSMNDKISKLEKETLDYREYIESFAHEIKTPISALSLSFDQRKDKTVKKEIDKIDWYVDQILYYARSENPEKDYFIKELNLLDVVHNVLLKYRVYLLDEKISVQVHDLEKKIYTDEKWLLFILSQILQNAMKYMDKKDKKIEIEAREHKDHVILSIKDNGCGIKGSDLPRVFEKGFTGSDRLRSKATGIGLYLTKKISHKLGLELMIKSKEKKGTTVLLILPKSAFHKM